jgi:hypothetical protein
MEKIGVSFRESFTLATGELDIEAGSWERQMMNDF